jgi:hypothetical protein
VIQLAVVWECFGGDHGTDSTGFEFTIHLNSCGDECVTHLLYDHNIRSGGPVGNGRSTGMRRRGFLSKAVTNGATLYFPAGDYRFATPNPAGGQPLHWQAFRLFR